MRQFCLAHVLSAALLLAASAGQAPAAQITRISWDVTGSPLDNPESPNPVDGGSVVYIPPGGSVSTPALGLSGGTLYGTFLAGSQPVFYLYPQYGNWSRLLADITPSGVFLFFSASSSSCGGRGGLTGHSGGELRVPPTLPSSTALRHWHVCNYGASYFSIRFTLGNEVRTIPEPEGPHLAWVALLALAWLAASPGAQRAFAQPPTTVVR